MSREELIIREIDRYCLLQRIKHAEDREEALNREIAISSFKLKILGFDSEDLDLN